MNILYVGDVMAEPGIKVVEKLLPNIRRKYKVDLVIAQAENLSDGKGVRVKDFRRLQAAGVDFCTGGNWSLHQEESIPLLNDPDEPIIRPANYPDSMPGKGYKTVLVPEGKVLVVSLLGQIVGRDSGKPTANPLKTIDEILEIEKPSKYIATVVNFHGDFSSEKKVIGYYLDSKVSAVIGDHWHIPTADAMVLPKGTAHITDVGMCGSLDSSLGVEFSSIIPRWLNSRPTRNVMEETGRMQFNSVLIEIDPVTRLARSIIQIQKVY
ncbi:MAG TPA: TIGR00282 family metallophosphoesterase [Candidatus Saccharimonadales bacterium]|nr:TIGR00282 family metallophosphoesterase [Candidatus Saccharimonadales bacterium]